MHRSIVTVTLFLLLARCCSAEPFLRMENIFPLGDKHAHSSSIVECPDGSLLACWFYGSGERTADDVVVQGSRRAVGGTEWSPVFLMADTKEFPDCNPVLFVDRKQRIWLFWITVLANRWECSQLKFRRADQDNGEGVPDWNWQGIVQLKPGETFARVMKSRFKELGVRESMWAEYAKPYSRMLVEAAHDPYKRQTGWMTRTHPLTLPNGRILLPLYSDGFNASLMGISDDEGETWRASAPIVGLGPIQPSVVRKQDGTLVAYCRDSGSAPNRILVSQSTDHGETWSAAIDTTIPNPGSSLELLVLRDGSWVLVCNDTERGRHRLTLMLSKDEGQTWTRRTVESSDARSKSFGYPSLIQTRDGWIHLTYSYQTPSGRSIRHCVTNREWIEQTSKN